MSTHGAYKTEPFPLRRPVLAPSQSLYYLSPSSAVSCSLLDGEEGGAGPERWRRAAAAARQLKKRSAWTGVRARLWGGWAVEIRVPLSRQRLWVGAFETDRQAALAYDAALFCFYGEDLPKKRGFNFPAAPRPDIDEDVRAGLSVAAVKDIANKHARGLQLGLAIAPPACTAAEPLQQAAAAAGPSAGADAPAAGYHGRNPNAEVETTLRLCL
ncbi:ethylene-responsive transcription factor RAP2-1-like [Panicum virgatum]|uniref:ethylene-responsive transcription factor RAP2-1-like n=1 Tax=Panicum virgatum TaxID=38727 RepID=UPI0019D650BE|nr:ethylene-responsive transcription factor RAP2-1-like [Panicum virgatum]